MRKRKWTIEQLQKAVKNSTSIRQVIGKLGLVEAGGNYEQVKNYIADLKLDNAHFTGMGWSKGNKVPREPLFSLESILVSGSRFQSFKLKKRLFAVKIKKPACEECGWAQKAIDGRIPVELDHINGDRHDNRLENLRVLCPNCHSLKSTHRGRNKKRG